jgi:hypothetical protein
MRIGTWLTRIYTLLALYCSNLAALRNGTRIVTDFYSVCYEALQLYFENWHADDADLADCDGFYLVYLTNSAALRIGTRMTRMERIVTDF